MNSQPAASASSLPQSPRMELSLRGIRIAPGLASGTVWMAGDILECSAETHRIKPHQVDAEMERIRRAFMQVEAELEESARRVSEQIDPSLGEIFRAHRLMLESLLASNEFEKELRGFLTSAGEAVKRVFRRWEAKFAAIEDETVHERADDILGLAR
jgi:phosphoenolpyruvate-protein kinase (PTS system EI component)